MENMFGTAAAEYAQVSFGLPGAAAAEALSREARAAKRTLDFVIAGAGLALLAPLMAAIALAIRLDSPGPALFRQTRGGLRGRLTRPARRAVWCCTCTPGPRR